MDAEQWGRQPWWAQQAYIEGMLEDEYVPLSLGEASDVDPVMASDADLRALGLRVIDGG